MSRLYHYPKAEEDRSLRRSRYHASQCGLLILTAVLLASVASGQELRQQSQNDRKEEIEEKFTSIPGSFSDSQASHRRRLARDVIENEKLIASDASADDYMGGSVSVWGNVLAVGAAYSASAAEGSIRGKYNDFVIRMPTLCVDK